MKRRVKGTIEVDGLRYFVPIGYYTHEHAFPVEVEVSFRIFIDYPEEHKINDLEDTVSYEPFIDAVTQVLKEAQPLIEQIAFAIKDQFIYIVKDGNFKVDIKAFEVTVEKKEILVPGPTIDPKASITIEWEI
ncbi:MAG: dihydroneopterin aldolase [Chlorobi bacterium]|nr:dihydroneopterin aldolase [Chlorobiota bacterium]